MIARQTLVQVAISFKGKREEVVSIYNEKARPLPRGYRVKVDDMLCATYTSVPFLVLGWQDIVPPECGAMQLYRNMEALGRAVLDKNRVPEIGDLMFFGNGTSVSRINHVAIVTEVKGKQIYYYDLQSVVGRHTCPVGYSYIIGYGMPDYQSKDLEPVPEPEPEPDVPHVFKPGDLVVIKPGARWYKGQTIKASVFDDKWYVISAKGDRVVLGMNIEETRNIQSPIHDYDISLVVPNEPVIEPVDEKMTKTIVINKNTNSLLEAMASECGKTVGEVVDMLVEEAR